MLNAILAKIALGVLDRLWNKVLGVIRERAEFKRLVARSLREADDNIKLHIKASEGKSAVEQAKLDDEFFKSLGGK